MSSEPDLDEYDIRDAGDLTPFSPPECLDCGACCHADYVHVWVSGSDHARLTPEERERLIKLYPFIKQSQDALRLPETRYAEPAVIYPAIFER